ncbi:cytidine deaminase [Auriculariales sp. MPI-PUGE-AT-0066]|nr:cytidine deaminase [Auriculariales sp. MPI-PUGE-AT-0066]
MASLTAQQREQLIAAAFEARDTAYAPYSKFRVGAALQTTDGQILKGSNIENASYGGTICAERTALVKAVLIDSLNSERQKSFSGLAVVSDVAAAISPCGICRQFIREFCEPKMPILLVPADYSATAKTGEKARCWTRTSKSSYPTVLDLNTWSYLGNTHRLFTSQLPHSVGL